MSSDQLAQFIADEWILSGKLAPGQQFPSERGLAEMLGVSRTTLRQAVRRLAERKLVDILPGKGTYVRQMRTSDAAQPLGTLMRHSQATTRDVMAARAMIESHAARAAAERQDADASEAIMAALTEFEQATTLADRVRADLAFHRSVVRAAGNPVIDILFDSMAQSTVEMMVRSLGDPNVSREGIPYHQDIFRAIVEGEGERAGDAARAHLLVVERSYGPDLDVPMHEIGRREIDRLLGSNVSVDTLIRDPFA
jgi:DNA-binding FadR family transcriptional regulator